MTSERELLDTPSVLRRRSLRGPRNRRGRELPRVPRRPLQARRALRLLQELLDDPEQTQRVFELIEAVGGSGDDRTFRRFVGQRAGRFASQPDGLRLLDARPSLIAHLADRTALAALPDGSFGRAYLAFAEHNGIAAEGLVAANHAAFAGGPPLDPQLQWFFDRLNAMHDLWHVLSGYGTDDGGEAALLAFSRGAGLANRGLAMLQLATMLMAPKSEGFLVQRYLVAAYRRGRRTSNLLAAPYEELLPQPLVRVRRRLAIAPVSRAHPRGLLRLHREDARYELVSPARAGA